MKLGLAPWCHTERELIALLQAELKPAGELGPVSARPDCRHRRTGTGPTCSQGGVEVSPAVGARGATCARCG